MDTFHNVRVRVTGNEIEQEGMRDRKKETWEEGCKRRERIAQITKEADRSKKNAEMNPFVKA